MKIIYIGFMTLMFLASLSLVVAQNETNVSDETNLVIAPTPTLYSDNSSMNLSDDEQTVGNFRYGWEKFKLFFIRNETNRIQQELKLASWKLVEARKAAKDKDFVAAENALKIHDELLAKIDEDVDQLKNSNRSLTPGLDQAISVHEERLSRLSLFLQNETLSDDQRAKIEERVEKLENNTAHLSDIREKLSEKRAEKLSEFEDKIESRVQNQTERANRIEQRIENKSRNESESNESEED